MTTKTSLGTMDDTGAVGEVLTGQGTGNAPAWGVAGGMVLVSSVTVAAAASIDFDGVLTNTYDQYFVVTTDLHCNTDQVQMWIRTSSDGGASYDAGAGEYNWNVMVGNRASQINNFSEADTKIVTTSNGAGASIPNEAYSSSSMKFYIENPSGTTFHKRIEGVIKHMDADDSAGGAGVISNFNGVREATTAIDSFQILPSSGTIDGTVRLYGIVN